METNPLKAFNKKFQIGECKLSTKMNYEAKRRNGKNRGNFPLRIFNILRIICDM